MEKHSSKATLFRSFACLLPYLVSVFNSRALYEGRRNTSPGDRTFADIPQKRFQRICTPLSIAAPAWGRNAYIVINLSKRKAIDQGSRRESDSDLTRRDRERSSGSGFHLLGLN